MSAPTLARQLPTPPPIVRTERCLIGHATRTPEGVPEHADRVNGPEWEAESRELVARVQAGSGAAPGTPGTPGLTRDAQDAFQELWARYYGTVHLYLRFRMRSDDNKVDDLAADTFVKGLRYIHKCRPMSKTVGAWFVTIARNTMFDFFKKASTIMEIACADMFDVDERLSLFEDPECCVVRRQSLAQVVAALDTLTAEQRKVMILRHFYDLSVEETRKIMGGETGRIKALQHRATVAMRERVPEWIR